MDLSSFLNRVEHLRRIAEHLTVDMRTVMPPAAIEDRIIQIKLVEDQITAALVSDELGELLDGHEGNEAWVEVARRDRQMRMLLGNELRAQFQDVTLNARKAWREARETKAWAEFVPWLGRIVQMNRDTATAMGLGSRPHDSILSVYEPGPSESQLDQLFSEIRPTLIALNSERPYLGERRLPPADDWLSVAKRVVAGIGLDLARGDVIQSDYPYSNPGGPNDTRVTLLGDMGLADVILMAFHEGGHAVYEQNVSPVLWGTPAGRGAMPYLHETASAIWHNTLSRTPEGIRMAARCVTRGDAPPDELVRDLEYAFIGGRVDDNFAEADELSFVLMAMLRVEVEKALLGDGLDPSDVPDYWIEVTNEYFGSPPLDVNAVLLLDPHWCNRYMGIFASYVLGNVLAAALLDRMHRDGVDTAGAVASGGTGAIVEWLTGNFYGFGRTTTMVERYRELGFKEWDTGPYLAHIRARYGN